MTVICGAAAYAGSGQGAPPAGVSIRRLRAGGFSHGKARKLASYASFAVGAAWQVVCGPRVDVVVSMTSPPLLGLLGYMAQRRGARHYIWEMDVYPDVAVELAVFRRGGLADRVSGWLADFPRRRADGIIALGPCMAERLQRRGLGDTPITVVHNWADGETLRPRPFLRDGRLKVFYSGNLGLAHDFETVVPAVQALDQRYLFRFSGGGPRRAEVERALGGLAWCEFRGYHRRDDLAQAFGENDIGLVTQRASTVGTLVPSKVYGVMAAGRGVLYVGPAEATVGRIIAEYGVGWRVDNGDVAGLRALLERLQSCPGEVEETGWRARAVFEREFDRRGQVAKIWQVLTGPGRKQA
jgi:colanic acid biosynthesis glycosyl transferase WcaI